MDTDETAFDALGRQHGLGEEEISKMKKLDAQLFGSGGQGDGKRALDDATKAAALSSVPGELPRWGGAG